MPNLTNCSAARLWTGMVMTAKASVLKVLVIVFMVLF